MQTDDKEKLRNELYERIQPNSSSKLLAAGIYILFPLLAIIFGLLFANPIIDFIIIFLIALLIIVYSKDVFVAIHCSTALTVYVVMQILGIIIGLLLVLALFPTLPYEIEEIETLTEIPQEDLTALYSMMEVIALFALIYLILYFIISIILAIYALLGKKIRLPIITDIVLDKFITKNRK